MIGRDGGSEKGTDAPQEHPVTGPRIAIVDDHALMRCGLAGTVQSELGARVVYQGAEPADVLTIDPPPDILLLDLDLGDSTADPEMAARIEQAGCRVLVVSAMAVPEVLATMMDAGVSGFVSKKESPETLVKAIRYVLANGNWTSPEVAAVLVSRVTRAHLSPAQERVLVLYASGMTLESVARHVGISVGTANTHLKRARAKYADLGRPAGSRIDLYRAARADGIIKER